MFEKKSGNNTFLEMIKYENIINFYSNYFYIEGDYYLLKLNVSEMMEHLNQLINIFTIYNCNMTVEYVWTIFMVLMLESFHNAFILFRGKITSDTRDNQALIDLLVDFFCVAFPLVVLFFCNWIADHHSHNVTDYVSSNVGHLCQIKDYTKAVYNRRSSFYTI